MPALRVKRSPATIAVGRPQTFSRIACAFTSERELGRDLIAGGTALLPSDEDGPADMLPLRQRRLEQDLIGDVDLTVEQRQLGERQFGIVVIPDGNGKTAVVAFGRKSDLALEGQLGPGIHLRGRDLDGPCVVIRSAIAFRNHDTSSFSRIPKLRWGKTQMVPVGQDTHRKRSDDRQQFTPLLGRCLCRR